MSADESSNVSNYSPVKTRDDDDDDINDDSSNDDDDGGGNSKSDCFVEK